MDAMVVAALEALRLALAKCQGRRPSFLQLLYPDGTIEQYGLCEGSMPESLPASPTPQVVIEELTDHEQAILRVLARAEKPLKSRAIATRAGIRYSSHLRELLTGLKEKGLVVLAPRGGYWPANRPLPDGS